MRKSPIIKGRERAVKRVITVLERERKAAYKSMMNVLSRHSEHEEESIIAHARYVETVGLQEALTEGLKELLGKIDKKKSPDATPASDTAVQPPDSTKETA